MDLDLGASGPPAKGKTMAVSNKQLPCRFLLMRQEAWRTGQGPSFGVNLSSD